MDGVTGRLLLGNGVLADCEGARVSTSPVRGVIVGFFIIVPGIPLVFDLNTRIR